MNRMRAKHLMSRAGLSMLFAVLLLFSGIALVDCFSDASTSSWQVDNRQSSSDSLARFRDLLMKALEESDGKGFLAFCSHKGVAFGVDSPEIDWEELRRQLFGKKGVYCLLFDTDCLRKQAGFEKYHSFRDFLRKAESREIKLLDSHNGDQKLGEIRIFLKGGLVDPNTGEFSLDFGLRLEEGKWRISSVNYP